MKRIIPLAAVFILSVVFAFAGGQEEAAASATRGKYLAGRGVIVPPHEVHVNSYIAQIDYNYPNPERPVGITLISGNRQISAQPHREIIHVGIKGKAVPFEELPPLNLAFVIDKSGSMEWEEKMDWVKESFDIFIERVREIDYISLVVFDDMATVLFPSTQMNSEARRMQFKNVVHQIQPGGGTNLVAGLELGYVQVVSNFRREYTNRVLFLTDGVGESEGILDMAQGYKEMAVNVSTIGVGQDFDLDLMVELAKAGGSSRFISDREEMAETFGSELDRMVVAAARDLQMRLDFPEGVHPLRTWGYKNRIEGRTIHYAQDTLHNGDYETILAEVMIPEGLPAGEFELAQFSMTYRSLEGTTEKPEPLMLSVNVVEDEFPTVGFSNSTVLKSSSMLDFATGLINIGNIYYGIQEDYNILNEMKAALWEAEYGGRVMSDAEVEETYGAVRNAEIESLEGKIRERFDEALAITSREKKKLENTRLRLDNIGFEDEIFILDSYIDILGGEMEMAENDIVTIKENVELPPPVEDRSVVDHINNLFGEVILNLEVAPDSIIAVSGFTTREGAVETDLVKLLDESALLALRSKQGFQIVERGRINQVIEEQKLQLTGLTDTDTAIEVGKILSADYILTGTIIEMSRSVIIFSRIINTESAEIESVAQVIIPKTESIRQIL